MRITIASRFRPYSHTPGATCLLPKSCWVVQAYPTLLRLYPLVGKTSSIEIPLPFSGPVREFTLQQDLEKGCVWVWGKAKEGSFRLRLEAEGEVLRFEEREIALSGPFRKASDLLERISFGSHKAQDWDAAGRRADPLEMNPVLFALSQWTPVVKSEGSAMFDLLEGLDEPFLRAAFYGILCPRLIDDQHQGLLPKEEISENASPLALITNAGAKIRKGLLEQKGNRISLFAPKPSGRMTHAKLEGLGLLHFEWRQGRIRRAIFQAKETASLSLDTPDAKTFRLKAAEHERGRRVDASSEWKVEKDGVYFLDRFEK